MPDASEEWEKLRLSLRPLDSRLLKDALATPDGEFYAGVASNVRESSVRPVLQKKSGHRTDAINCGADPLGFHSKAVNPANYCNF